MSVLEMMMALEACGDADVEQYVDDDGDLCYDVTLYDEWGYSEPALAEDFPHALAEQGSEVPHYGDLYRCFEFDGFYVCLGYQSFDD